MRCPSALLSLLLAIIGPIVIGVQLTERYLSVPVDHAAPWRNRSLSLRYLIDTTHFAPNGPLIVYCGNEGSIDRFSTPDAAGLQLQLVEKFKGAAIWLEERYYGKSFPEVLPGEPRFAFLSSAQVVADYAVALAALRRSFNTTKVLAIGGSYGGMLAAYLRKRHPDLVDAALASSAPVLGYAQTLIASRADGSFYDITAKAYPCRTVLGTAFKALWSAPQSSWAHVNQEFGLCSNSSIRDRTGLETLIGFLQQSFSQLAFVNYPYAAGDMPAHPTRYACSRTGLASRGAPAWSPLRDALSWSYQRPGTCLALGESFAAHTPGFLPGPWTFQRCTDLIMAFSVGPSNQMFLSCDSGFTANCAAQGLASLRAFCKRQFGVLVPDSQVQQDFWGSNWEAAGGGSKIIFSNGDLDPWSYGGFSPSDMGGHASMMGDVDQGPVVIHMKGGAHHIDLRSSQPNDPLEVRTARENETAILSRWLALDK